MLPSTPSRETDRDILGAAASIFIVSSVKIPTEATTLITSELNHQLPDQRIAAVYRFQALWRNRHQVWQRLEENGQLAMKVTPSQIEFTLPSPKLGLESSQVIDAPWEPRMKTKVSNAVHDRGQVRVRGKVLVRAHLIHWSLQMLLSATKSHRKNQIELVQSVLHAEEEKRRRERELFHITAVPLLSRASQEPGLFVLGGVAGDDHVECKSDQPRFSPRY